MIRNTCISAAIVAVVMILVPGSALAQPGSQGQGFPFFAPWTKPQPPKDQVARPFWPPVQPARRQQQAKGSFFPWFSQTAPTPRYNYSAPTYRNNLLSPFQSGTMMNPGMNMNMLSPMMQGTMGFMAPMAVNYAVASMNPTTMTNFFNLMAQPNSGFGGMGFGAAPRAPAFPFAAQPAPRTAPNPFTAFFGARR